MEYKEPQPVGLELVERVHNDPAAPHAAFKCTMCECFFNDDNARMLHCKGRRHRLNYKVGGAGVGEFGVCVCVCVSAVCGKCSFQKVRTYIV